MKYFYVIFFFSAIVISSCKKDSTSFETVGLYSYYDENGKWGYIDKDGVIKIDAQWDNAFDFYLGYGIVSKNNLYGLIDVNGNEVIPLKYQSIGNFEPDLKSLFNPKFFARAKLNGMWGMIDEHDNVVIPFNYKMLSNFSDGLAAFRTDILYGYINESGDVALPAIYDGYGNFSNNLAWVGTLVGGVIKWGVINKTGETVIPFDYGNVEGSLDKTMPNKFVDGVSPYFIYDTGSGFMSITGEQVFPTDTYWWTGNFSEGLAGVGNDGLQGFIDKTGFEVIPRQFYTAYNFLKGSAPFKYSAEGLWGYIKPNGEVLMSPQFLSAWNLNEDLGWAVYPDSTGAYVNKYGEVVWRGATKWLARGTKNNLISRTTPESAIE
jgi:hypothetical protein